jgi:YVTN family beta-propeller protein
MRGTKFLASFLLLTLFAAASAAQLRQVAMIDIPGRPGFDGLAFVGKLVVMSHGGAGTLDVFDPARRRVIVQVPGMSNPRGIAVDAAAGKVYVANAGNNTIAVVNTSTWKAEDSIALPASPDALLWVPERKTLYAGHELNQSISAVSPGAGGEVSTIAVGGTPEKMVFDPGRNLLFAAIEDTAEIIAIDSANRVVHRFKLKASLPTGLAFDPQGNRLYVAVRAAVLALDPDSGAELARVPSAPGTDSLWYDQSTHSVYAAAGDGSVNMIRTADNKYFSEHELKTQVKGHTLAYDSGRSFVYMPGGREGRSKLVILKRYEGAPTQEAGKNPRTTPLAQ